MDTFCLPQIDKEQCLSWRVDVPPCQEACPLGIDVEGYLSAIAGGDFEAALAIIRERCALPSVCGRVCHHPCEKACKRGLVDEPLSIMALKRFAADVCLSHEQRANPRKRTRTEKIAVIGSGPAGLAAAYELVIMGFGVTVFEAMDIPGGMLAYGIPEFTLPQEIVQGEIGYIRSLGVEISTGIRVGTDITLQELEDQGYNAILIATGAQESTSLPTVPGSDLEGILDVMPFLRQAKLEGGTALSGRIVVIGGGNSAIDAARTALRLGAEDVRMICLESMDDMPAFDEMKEAADSEGIVIETSLAPQSFQSDDGKRVSRIILRRVTSFLRDSEGQIKFQIDDDPQGVVERDVSFVIVAIGQMPDPVFPDSSINRTAMGTLECDHVTGTTKTNSIFGAGDVVDNPGTVTEAMAGGRRVADYIARFLDREVFTQLDGDEEPYTGREIVPQGITPDPRRRMAFLPPEKRVKDFQEVKLGFTMEEAMEEAARCCRCKTCNRCVLETRCVALPLMANKEKMSPYVKGMVCAGCGRCVQSCPFTAIHLTEFQ